ncbi:fanconi-associated nuclease 1 homolog [Aristolochia californica]|uniref:fanconi-associated nuclease 1 homolog n=1 Tax=Aristolochia californica TaxID=171875 RepID=UPI0035D65A27
MLTGRESLIRLIGKRRRNLSLPSLHSVQVSSFDLPGEDQDGPSDLETGTSGCSGYSLDVDWVTCPVCGNSVRGSDYIINSHLDICLVRGKKRKLTQRTLLHFNFLSDLNNKPCFVESAEIKANAKARVDNDPCTPSTPENFYNSMVVQNNKKNGSELDLDQNNEPVNIGSHHVSITNLETSIQDLPENLDQKHSTKCEEVEATRKRSLLSIFREGDDLLMGTLETYIVGHSFCSEIELNQGGRLCLMRDPGNFKDSHAIKVLYMDSGCEVVVGFLPRELAQYLSPLIDKYNLRFEGSVIASSEYSTNVIPIQLALQEMIPYAEMTENDLLVFLSLWENVVQVVESAKSFPANMTRYQRNFCYLIQEVLKSQSHLFTDDEKLFLESFYSLSDDSQRLFIRLYSRKGPWFRMSNISYPEISDPQQAVEQLCAFGFLTTFESMKMPSNSDVQDVLHVLIAPELREIFNLALLKLNKSAQCTRKKELIKCLSASYEDGTCPGLPRMVSERTSGCVQLSSSAESLLWRIQRLFFLNGEQDLSAFLLVDLGLVKYPSYICNISCPIFPNQTDLIAYEEAIEVAQLIDQYIDDDNMEMVTSCIEASDHHISAMDHKLPRTWLSCFSASWVHSKVLTLGVSFFERERRYKEAIKLLKRLLSRFTSDGRRGYWTLRLSVDLEHVGLINESLVVAEEGVRDPCVRAGSKMALERRVLRLGKPPRRWKIPTFAESINRKIKEVHVRGRPLNCEAGIKNRFYGEDGEQYGVEELALQYYAGEGGGWKGAHTESGIWITIFGLLMWDIIFADVPDVFQTKFQTAPLDLETDSFYASREGLIESQLEKIYNGMAEEILIISWESHVGTACRGVNWERLSLDDLRAVVTCTGGPCLASLCRYLAEDYRSWSSGMPDLLLWRFVDERGEVKLVEVKSPKDRLSEQQRAWLLLLMDSGFDTEVCKVGPSPPCT